MTPPTGQWYVVVPVKSLAAAKTRLAMPPTLRLRFAAAMALDTVAAAMGCPAVSVVVVTDEDPGAFTALGAVVVPDAPRAGLNAAIVHGAASAPAGAGTAALSADLPALRAAELADALAQTPPGGRAAVADATGLGTTLLAAAPGVALAPAFGAASFARHLGGGARPVVGPLPGLRHDVDTTADLAAAASFGVGVCTAALLLERVEPPA